MCRNERYALWASINFMDYNVPTLHWYAFKVFYNKVFEIEELLKKDGIETFIPCETVIVERGEVKKSICKPVIASLLFFRSTEQQALHQQQCLLERVILYTRLVGWQKLPFAIPEREMNLFMLVATSGEQGLEYLCDSPRDYRIGQHVSVIDGPFKGAEGYIHRIKGNRRLIVAIEGVCAVATAYIPQCFLRNIETD
jgi:transcription antitermination factor NusG